MPAKIAAKAERWADVTALTTAFLKERPGHADALLLAGEAAARQGELKLAIQRYSAVADDAGREAAIARLCAGDLRLRLGRLSEAERDFRSALALNSEDDQAISRLALLLVLSGRRWEAGPYLLELVKRDQGDLQQLCQLGDPARVATNEDQLSKFFREAPGDPLPALGLARLAIVREQVERAELLLRSVIEQRPDLIEAQVRLGDLLVRRGEAGVFLAWHNDLPKAAEQHPHLWYVRGMFATSRGETESAARCFWEALKREPCDVASAYQLGQMLLRLGRPSDAEAIGNRAKRLQRVAEHMSLLQSDPRQGATLLRETVETLRDLGRIWETGSWLRVAAMVEPDAQWVAAENRVLDTSLPPATPQTLPQSDPTALIDCSMYALPAWKSSPVTPTGGGADPSSSNIRFDLAGRGIDFRYFNSADPGTQGVRMFEFTGGGVGATDFDADGRPDLYFTQGCRWPPDVGQREFLDRVYRNLGGRFTDVTDAAGLVEAGFSQGVACGDFDDDGFQDLYVGNIGSNRLFRNNGDGTFREATTASDVFGNDDAWTTSVAIADLNGDGLPDLYDVNYVRGENVYDMICGRDGISRACSPTTFEGSPDRLLLNRGDGTFSDETAVAGIDGPDGTGLGIVAADFDGSGRLSLFIANDAQNNHFYANASTSTGGPPRFEEQALLNGTAYDRDGHAQACMGVAAGDADGDGRLDLLVTNYVDESNTLYRQESDGLFADASRVAGLTAPSFDRLGFGTQFLDADLDGREDLVVTNGHIDDFTHQGYEHRMPPQVFRNVGGRFEAISSETAGAFFGEGKLGRGLARIDWNGDGRDEFAVSHLEDPASLLTNTTSNAGRSLSIRLRATRSARDAIGSIVTVQAGDRRFVRQLTAGDGYQASNEKKLVFGIGDAGRADSVVVRWPSGAVDTFRDLAAGSDSYIIEGRLRPFRRMIAAAPVAPLAAETSPPRSLR